MDGGTVPFSPATQRCYALIISKGLFKYKAITSRSISSVPSCHKKHFLLLTFEPEINRVRSGRGPLSRQPIPHSSCPHYKCLLPLLVKTGTQTETRPPYFSHSWDGRTSFSRGGERNASQIKKGAGGSRRGQPFCHRHCLQGMLA